MSLNKLAKFLQHSRIQGTDRRVTLLPDLFVDQIITIPKTPSEFLLEARRIVSRGGGNYTGVTADLTRGGCAANCAAALSGLNVHTTLITKTNEVGVHLLKLTSNLAFLDLSHVKTATKSASTAALETQEKGQLFNIMVTDSNPVASFSEHDLDRADFNALKSSSIVGIFSWNLLEKGTELVEKVAKFCSENAVRTFADLGDPTPLIRKLPLLIDKVLSKGIVNYLSLNENELRSVSKSLTIKNWRNDPPPQLAKEVAKQLPLEIALHTPNYSCLTRGKRMRFCPSFDIMLRRGTGAGDAWNAGNIYGLLMEAEPETRLMMGNLLAALYISSRQPEVQTLRNLSIFLKRARLKRVNNLSKS